MSLSVATLRTLRTLLPADIPLIGCGGISSGEDALAFAKAGASSVQLYTVMSTEGAGAARRIKDELVKVLDSEAKKSWADVVKSAIHELANTHPLRYEARQAKANAPPTEETFVAEAEELKREAEALKKLLLEAGIESSQALTEALSATELDDTLRAMGLEPPSDNQPSVGGPSDDANAIIATVSTGTHSEEADGSSTPPASPLGAEPHHSTNDAGTAPPAVDDVVEKQDISLTDGKAVTRLV